MAKEYYPRQIVYLDNYKYQLFDTYYQVTSIYPVVDIVTDYIRLDTRGLLIVHRGYAWDGASGWFDSQYIMRGSLVHDALIQLVQSELLSKEWKRKIDMELYNCCRQDGMGLIQSIAVLTAVQFHDWTKTPPRVPIVSPRNVR